MDDNGFMAKFSSVDHFFIFVFILVFALTAFWQYIWAFRPIQDLMKKKWLNHLGLAFINLLLLRILFAGSALWAARLASRHHWGVFQNVETGFMFSVVFTVIFLDWMAYYLHRIYHAVPFLWNIHRVHHTDTEVESTTGVRFHPLEQVITALWKGMFIVLLGAPFSGVFIYEAILIAANLFDHSNARLSKWLEPWVRFLS